MEYILKRSKRKTISLNIDDELNVVVHSPYFVPKYKIEEFVNQNESWILTHLDKKKKYLEKEQISLEDEEKYRKEAKEYLPEKLAYYAEIMGVHPKGIKITSARKRFGSCGPNDTICFSWRLMTYPKEAVDYVIVHELSHLVERNHSSKFYDVVRKYMPDYKEREKLLK